jgi:hypothetical protein
MQLGSDVILTFIRKLSTLWEAVLHTLVKEAERRTQKVSIKTGNVATLGIYFASEILDIEHGPGLWERRA